ncbi:phage Gp37/Gp68 family protein [Pedobacter frigiditerrae]|uniref:Phage Gp37/Gp68 family protein n=1 Tax=Pedobacter frigiditerrae TaxID=2530452 RepID=A0A4R0N3T6_9SPHI|nr:phage Gp37/Gp68 family protein [Pedobacter frigiditerrae]TCC94033.1 phage Gp37/Gp68 family protein [Pedobacter frigiditerrae]
MAESTIEWTELTWNPVTGCKKISPGCKFCYAEVMSRRLKAMRVGKYKDGFKIRIHPESLNIPFTWKKPKVVFVNSMSDLFHDEIPLDFIKAVFAVMNSTPQHTYQVLTKRSDRLLAIARELNWTQNIWMGVSVENEKYVHRVVELSQTPARTKFLSIEPLLGPIKSLPLNNIDWVIVGGESGHGARPVKFEWIDYIRQQCESLDVPFFFKQWGKPKFNNNPDDPTIDKEHPRHAKGGCELDGVIYRELPIAI